MLIMTGSDFTSGYCAHDLMQTSSKSSKQEKSGSKHNKQAVNKNT